MKRIKFRNTIFFKKIHSMKKNYRIKKIRQLVPVSKNTLTNVFFYNNLKQRKKKIQKSFTAAFFKYNHLLITKQEKLRYNKIYIRKRKKTNKIFYSHVVHNLSWYIARRFLLLVDFKLTSERNERIHKYRILS